MSLSSQPVVDALHTLHGPFERAGIGQVALDRLDAVQRLQAMDVFTGSHQRPPGRFAALGGARSAANQLSQRPANGSAAWSRRQSNHHAYESEYGSDWHFDVREGAFHSQGGEALVLEVAPSTGIRLWQGCVQPDPLAVLAALRTATAASRAGQLGQRG